MTDLTLAELICITDIVESDIDRSVYQNDLTADDWACVDNMEHFTNRASAFAKLKKVTQGINA